MCSTVCWEPWETSCGLNIKQKWKQRPPLRLDSTYCTRHLQCQARPYDHISNVKWRYPKSIFFQGGICQILGVLTSRNKSWTFSQKRACRGTTKIVDFFQLDRFLAGEDRMDAGYLHFFVSRLHTLTLVPSFWHHFAILLPPHSIKLAFSFYCNQYNYWKYFSTAQFDRLK